MSKIIEIETGFPQYGSRRWGRIFQCTTNESARSLIAALSSLIGKRHKQFTNMMVESIKVTEEYGETRQIAIYYSDPTIWNGAGI